MTGKPPEPASLLHELVAAPPDQRERLLTSSAGGRDVGELISNLAAAAEDAVIEDLQFAVAATDLLVRLADAMASPSVQSRVRRARAHALPYANRFEESLAVISEGREIALRAGDELEAVRQLSTMLHPLARLGRLDEAVSIGEEACEALVRLGQPLVGARAGMNLGIIHRMLNDYEEAVRRFRWAESIVTDDPIFIARLKSNIAEVLLDLHHFQEAEPLFHESLRIFEEQKAGYSAAIVAGNLGDLLYRQGRFGEAMTFYEQARAIFEANRAEGDAARLQAEQADTLSALGAHSPAVTAYSQAIPILNEFNLVAEAARANAGLGKTLLALGQYQAAVKPLEAAIEGFKSLPNRAAEDRARITRALAAAAAGDAFDAQRALAELIERLADYPADRCTAHLALATLLIDNGRYDEALPIVNGAVRQAAELGLSPLHADALHTRARLFLARNDLRAAHEDLREAVDQIERTRGALRADRLRLAFFAQRHHVYEDAFRATILARLPGWESEAFEIAERAKSRGLLDLLRADAAPEPATPPAPPPGSSFPALPPIPQRLAEQHRTLNALYAELEEPRRDKEDPAEQVRWRKDWLSRLADCEQTIALLESRLTTGQPGADLFAAPVTLEDFQQLIETDTAVLEYFMSSEQIHCLVIRRDQVDVRTLDLSRQKIDELAKNFGFQIGRAIARSDAGQTVNNADALRRELRGLHQHLLAPLVDLLAGVDRLRIIPHGPLHALPFHAFLADDGYLIQHVSLSTAPSATVLAHLASSAAQRPAAPGRALVVGISDKRIPHAEVEARAVADLLPEAQRLLGREATIDAFRKAAADAPVLHLATHARFSASDPLASGLKLADGWITAREIAGLRLHGATVVLSACESGRTGTDAGGEILGLLRAFLVAGASSLIVSHWPVSDTVAHELMGDAYREWHTRHELSLAQCLRQAMLRAVCRRPHPAEWAPFFTVGM